MSVPQPAEDFPSHGIVVEVWWDSDDEPQLSYLPPGVSMSWTVPEGRSIRRCQVGPWKPPPRREVEMEQGWCQRCMTACGREKGSEKPWYNQYGRSECRAAEEDGVPHDVIDIYPRRNAGELADFDPGTGRSSQDDWNKD